MPGRSVGTQSLAYLFDWQLQHGGHSGSGVRGSHEVKFFGYGTEVNPAVAQSMGLASASVEDDPEDIYHAAQALQKQLPALINIRTERHYWHAGIGVDAPPTRDRLAQFKGSVPQAQEIENDMEQYMETLWQKHLQTP